MSGSIPDSVLSSLAHPATINLLQDYKDASSAANAIWENRNWQAKQAAGNAFRSSINPDGTPNQTQLNQNLAADPTTALAAQQSSQAGQTLDSSTYVTHMARLSNLSGAAMALLAQHPDGNVTQAQVYQEIDQQAQRLGMSPADIAHAKSQFGADPAANYATILRNHGTSLNAQQALMAAMPSTGTFSNGQTTTGIQTPPQLGTGQLGAITPVGQPQQHVTGPDFNAGLQKITIEDPQRPGTYIDVFKPRSDLPGASGAAGGGTAPAAAPGAGGAPGATPGAAPAAPAAAGRGTPPVPSPIPGGGVYRSRSAATPPGAPATGTPAATPAPVAPTSTAPAPSAAPTAPAPSTPAAAPTQTPASASTAPVILAGPPQAQPAALGKDVEAFKTAQAAIGPGNTSIHNLQNAYEALKLTNSGSGTEATHKLYSFIENQAPDWLKSQHLTDDVKNYDLFRKYTEKYALDQSAGSNTDAGRSMTAQSNAGTAISTPANLDVMRAEIGRQRQAIASVLLHKDPTGNGWGDANARFMTGTDPHGFAWDMYSPAERQAMINKAKENGSYDKLVASVKAGVESHQVNVPTAPPQPAPAAVPQQPSSASSVPRPQALAHPLVNLLAAGTSQLAGNALAPQQRNLLAVA
jgi:hypothetical protein